MRPLWHQNLNSSNLTPSPGHKRQPSLSCPNHPGKPVTHALVAPGIDQDINYCQKCSIMLASQGFNVVKLSKNLSEQKMIPLAQTGNNERQREVSRFIADLNSQIELIRGQGLEVEDKLKQSQQNYSTIMDSLTSYFSQIQTIIEIQKYTAYNSVLTQRAASQSQLRAVRDALFVELEGLSGISSDIENNMEAVESVEHEVYLTIMQNYRTKLGLSSQIQDLQIGDIPLAADIVAQIPKELYSIAEKIQLRGEVLAQPELSSRQVISIDMDRSGKSSKVGNKRGVTNNTLSITASHKDDCTEHINSNYSFDNLGCERRQLKRTSFNQTLERKLMPHEMFFRQSLNLTEIRENQEWPQGPFRRFSTLQATIPEENQSSQESIDGYLAIDSIEHLRNETQPEETETLLIC